jgi:hypothetical protein
LHRCRTFRSFSPLISGLFIDRSAKMAVSNTKAGNSIDASA